jgi:hypothetical protein
LLTFTDNDEALLVSSNASFNCAAMPQ